jgi:EAL domain-containing protein (putative c-di-GMP-specific phosphodiesterase class I)
MTVVRPDPALWAQELRCGHLRLRTDAGQHHWLDHEGLALGSQFTPIFSRAHGRPVGHRGRLVVRDGARIVPEQEARVELERRDGADRIGALEAGLHMSNYRAHSEERGWLVLHVDDFVLTQPTLWPPTPQDLFSSTLYAPHDLVLEVSVEASTPDRLRDFVSFHQALGFAVALSDFGRRHADLCGIWAIRPDLVGISARVLDADEGAPGRRWLLDALCRVLHTAGAMVAIEGVQDAMQLERALDTEVDLIEGAATAALALGGAASVTASANTPRSDALGALRQRFAECAGRIATGSVFESACEPLLGEAGVLRCFLLDGQGMQLTDNLSPVGTRSDPRYWPLANALGASWAHRDYFRSALAHPGQVMVTPPYFSLPDGRPCMTLSMAVEGADGWLVLCTDLGTD